MALSCSCASEYEWYYKLTELKYSAGPGICYGCGKKIRTGDPVAKILAFDYDEDGEETESKVKSLMCEPCIDMHDNLEAWVTAWKQTLSSSPMPIKSTWKGCRRSTEQPTEEKNDVRTSLLQHPLYALQRAA